MMCVSGKVTVEVLGHVVRTSGAENVVLKLPEEVVEVEMEILCSGSGEAVERRPTLVVLATLFRVGKDFIG